MNRVVKSLVVFLVFGAVVAGAYFMARGFFGKRGRSGEDLSEWIVVDESYTPRDFVEEFIKQDAEQRGLLPVSIRNFGRNESVLRRFRGKNFAGPKKAQLNMMYQGLEDWMLVEIMFQDGKSREIRRTILYVQIGGRWRVGDSGNLVE